MGTIISIFSKVKDIILELAGYFGDAKIIILATAAVATITLLTHIIFKKTKIMKYLPGSIVLGIGLFNYYSVKNILTVDESLINLLLFVVGTVAGLVGLLFALIIGIYIKPVKTKKRKVTRKTAEKTNVKEQR